VRTRESLLALLLTTVPGFAGAGVDVQVHAGRVDLKLSGAPLSEILDQLAGTLKFQLIREAGAPNPMLPALELKDRTPVEAVLGVLDGQGVNYAITMDASGSRVESLLLAAAKSAPAAPRATLPGRSLPTRGLRGVIPQPSDDGNDDAPEEEVVIPPPPEEEPAPPPAATPPPIAPPPGSRPGPYPQPTP
jgi:hypothetical protein